ncbi:DNA gyrase subunit A [Verrucomicrobium sp. 3C]|uniref:DNA gyrase subunit A n=1 Tax=Verrucomicrobium sp. 3C TaxID=1134055 RepID=UPI0003824354|nr:DNA gyrase subunit A [Verrucomicrobium sp. 3C]
MPDETTEGEGRQLLGGERFESRDVSEEMRNCFLDYAMSVIISRALPDVRDGLKPSQRRILYSMHELGLAPNRKHLKCAKIVGETMGNYHPHGDQAIYPTLVHMAQPWAMRDLLIDGQGNFGSVEGDPPAAMRYTEARLTHLGLLLMADMDKDTVDFVPNYDETRTEPVVFPAAFPNLLVNGSTGIAVGMATNIPPHNLGELVQGVCALIDNPGLTSEDLLQFVRGPDFPTGGIVVGQEGIRKYFLTGKGSVRLRARLHVEEGRNGRSTLIVDEIPFNVNRATLVERIGDLITEKLIDASDVRDESDENTRVVIELRRDAVSKVVENNLYRLTPLETIFAVNSLAIDGGRPRTLNLKEMLLAYLEHRREVVLRRSRFELRKAEERAEILEGYLIALANLDEFLRVIRGAANREAARIELGGYEFTQGQVEGFGIVVRHIERLVNGRYLLSDAQLDAILDLRLYQLTGLEREKIIAEYQKLMERARELEEILGSEARVLYLIRTELLEVASKRATPRRTEIVPAEGEVAFEDLVAREAVVITLTHRGYIKRTGLVNYRLQRRGGRGVIGMVAQEGERTEENDFVEHLFTASTHDHLIFFTTAGRAYVERVYEIPEMARAAKGRSIANVLELAQDEEIAALLRVGASSEEGAAWDRPGFLFFCTALGQVKKTPLSEFIHVRKKGIRAIHISERDRLIDVKFTAGDREVVLITREGLSIRFSEEEVRSMGRTAAGVRGIRLGQDDRVVAAALVDPAATLLVAGSNGLGKRTSFDEYRRQGRGGKGVITMKMTKRTGEVVAALSVVDGDELMLLTQRGLTVRTPVKGIRRVGRNTQGVRLLQLDQGDRLIRVARVVPDQEEEGEAGLLA